VWYRHGTGIEEKKLKALQWNQKETLQIRLEITTTESGTLFVNCWIIRDWLLCVMREYREDWYPYGGLLMEKEGTNIVNEYWPLARRWKF
jgi:hypothetical protein